MIARVVGLAGIMLFAAAGCAAHTVASLPEPSTAPANPVYIAIVEPEVFADLPAPDRQTLADALDASLSQSLAAQKGFSIVDRQAIDKVLAEHVLTAAGVSEARDPNAATITKAPTESVSEPLRPFWSAGVIVSPAVHIDFDPARKIQTATLIVDAVSSQTGQLLAEYVVRDNWKTGQPLPAPGASQLQQFWLQISRSLEQAAGRPLVEVSDGRLTSPLPRLAWMLDDLDDHLRAHVAAQGSVNLLVPRHPLFTKEERLLRVMGLAAAREGDPAAGLMAAPDGRLSAELIEQPGARIAFGKTPISILLTWTHDGKSVASEPIKGTVDDYETMRAACAAWLDRQLAGLRSQRPDEERDQAVCQRLAAQELATVEQMLPANTATSLGFFDSDPADNLLGARAYIHAARAAHLDPANRRAARLVAMLVHCAYYHPGQAHWSIIAYDRAIAESQRYIARFKVTASEDDHIYYRLVWAGEWAAEIEAGSRERMTNLTLTPMENIYRYTKISAQAALEVGMVRALEGSGPMRVGNDHLWSGAFRLRDWVMLNCPLDELDSERALWQKFWTDRVAKVSGDVPPWGFIMCGYYTRKKDYLSLRKTYNELAAEYPNADARVWNGAKVDIHLEVAGDPDWKTWRPQFPQNAPRQYRLDMRQSDSFFRRLIPQPAQDSQSLYPYDCRRLIFGADTIGAGYAPASDDGWIGALAITDDSIWFVTPAEGETPPASGARLFVCPLAEITDGAGKDIHPKPRPIPWPESEAHSATPDSVVPPLVKCSAVTRSGANASSTLWIGTLGSGLARFDYAGGKWKGRWYRGQQGLPVENIYWIAPCLFAGKQQLLMLGTSGVQPPKGPVVWIFDPSSGESKILYEDLKHPASGSLALSWPDGRKLSLSIADARVFPGMDLKDAAIVTSPTVNLLTMPADQPGANPRLWRINSPEGGELDPRTFKPLFPTAPPPGPNQFDGLFVEKTPGGANVRMPTRSVAYFGGFGAAPNPFAIPRRGVLVDKTFWLIDTQGFQLWGYSPAPAGDKDWARHDRWIGPFVPNGGGQILSLLPASSGQMFVTTSEYIDYLDTGAMLKTAEKTGRIHSTDQLKEKLQAHAAMPGWQGQAGRALLQKHFADALDVIDNGLIRLGHVDEKASALRREQWVDLMLWQGLVQARAGYWDEATDIYHQVAESPMSDAPAIVMSRLNAIATLYRAKRWQETFDEAQALGRQFPDLKVAPGAGSPIDRLPAQLADAAKKREQAATNPSLRPVDTHAPHRIARLISPSTATQSAVAVTVTDVSIGLQLIADCRSKPAATVIAGARAAGKGAIPGLVEGLKSSDAPSRLAAATLLRILASEGRKFVISESVVNDFTAAAQDDPAIRAQAFIAAQALGLAAKPMVPLMLKTLRDAQASAYLRFLATFVTGVAPDEPGLVELLMANAQDKDRMVRSSAIRALAALGKRSVAAKPLILAALKDPDADTRLSAVMALHAIGVGPAEEVALLGPLMKDPSTQNRVIILYHLGNLGPDGKAAIPVMVDALKDPEKWVQETAIQALGKMGKAALPAIADLKRFRNPDADPHLQSAADHAIKAIERSEE